MKARAGLKRALKITAQEATRERQATESMALFAQLYNIQNALGSLGRLANEHERRAHAHNAVAGLIREVIAAVHTTRRPR